jgi:mannose/cellobiose epimerase-like protein (N-acyl-D-glucosamine 2-epimerase family)
MQIIMKHIKLLLISILITFSICNHISAQGGTSFETAVQATLDTNNEAVASESYQYYYFTPDFNGYVVIGNCGLTWLDTEIEVYDSLNVQINAFKYYCNNQVHVVIPVDSLKQYYIRWYLPVTSNEQPFNWYLTKYYPEPGEFYQVSIPAEIGDTIDLIPIEKLYDIWYKIIPGEDKMIKVSACGLGNELYNINSIVVYQDSVNYENYNQWFEFDQNCSNGIFLEFPCTSGHVYYIDLHYIPSVTSARFSVTSRDFETGETCETAVNVQANTEHKISSGDKYSWYVYTPDKDEYMVTGCSQINPPNMNLFLKDDCDCEADYNTPGCMIAGSWGWAQSLHSGTSYYFAWNNLENKSTTWRIYEPTQIIDFQVNCQVKATAIDYVNHTVEITVGTNQDVTGLVPEYVQAGNVEFIVDGERQYSGYNEQDFTEPVTYTVRYIDQPNSDTVSQDWVVSVNKEEPSSGTYTVKSMYLKNPDLAKFLVSSWADFWKTAYDHEHGGFFTNIDQQGNPSGDLKTIVSQTQNAYAFARAFMVTGDTSYLSYSSKALQFMYDHYWDETNGGWYASVDANGDLIGSDSYNSYKWSFFQHYANLGMVAMADATGGARFENQNISGNAFNEHLHWEMLNQSLDVINENLWDDREEYYGYYYQADLDWGNPEGKGFTPTVDGITTHILYTYLLTKDPFFYTRLEQMANNIEEHMIPEMESVVLGYPELYDSDWKVQQGSDRFIGHMFKTAWCLARAYLIYQSERYRQAAKALMYDMLDNGAYDYYYGAPYSYFDCSTGFVDTDSKLFWEVEQAYTSGIMNYYISDDEDDRNKFIEIADGSIDFFMNHFADPVNGEVYMETDRQGNPDNTYKGSYDKAGYHSTELVYYTYLYGNLFYKKEPVELYYFIDASNQAQSVSLYPLAIEDNCLKIDAVELNDIPFENFNSDTRTLNIAANEGGIFKVTFRNDRRTGINKTFASNSLDVNVYPNPLINSSIVEYTIDTYTDVSVNVLDISGRLIYSIENKSVAPGIYHEKILREKLAGSNICLVQVKTNSQSNIVKLIIID